MGPRQGTRTPEGWRVGASRSPPTACTRGQAAAQRGEALARGHTAVSGQAEGGALPALLLGTLASCSPWGRSEVAALSRITLGPELSSFVLFLSLSVSLCLCLPTRLSGPAPSVCRSRLSLSQAAGGSWLDRSWARMGRCVCVCALVISVRLPFAGFWGTYM